MLNQVSKESVDLTQQNIEKLKELFPEILTDGNKVDFDMLQTILGEEIDGEKERYSFTWPGKRDAIIGAQQPSKGTLRPNKEKSKNFDTTENLYIEGDNLEVLRLLQKSYNNKIKMIYIDPPYNTGNDFVYKDNFRNSLSNYLEQTGQVDSEGNILATNSESNGRFHTDWLNMIYTRIKLARNLLTDNGVVFVSIDDNEVHNLRKICDEIFGEVNFINIITVKTKIGGVSGSSEGKSLKDVTEFILVYAKNKPETLLNPVYIRTPLFDRISSYLIEGKSWKYTSVMTKLEDKTLIKEDKVRGMKFWGYKTLETKSITAFAKDLGVTEEDVYNQYADRIFRTTNAQSSVRQTVIKETRGHQYPMYGCEYVPIKGKNEGKEIEILYKGGSTNDQRNMMMFLSDVVEKIDGTYYYMDRISSLWDDIEYNNLTKEGDIEFPNGKKPIKMIRRMIDLATEKESVVLDFFSGSASTAHAVMQQNTEDGGNRKFIMVQLPEQLEVSSNGYKEGFETICDMGSERIRRAGERIVKDEPVFEGSLDIGFKYLELDKSNIKEWNTDFDNLEDEIDLFAEVFVEGRKELDVVYEIMLKNGLELTLPINSFAVNGKTVYDIAFGLQFVCLADNIDTSIAKAIINKRDEYGMDIISGVVFKDAGFNGNDSEKLNCIQILKDAGFIEENLQTI